MITKNLPIYLFKKNQSDMWFKIINFLFDHKSLKYIVLATFFYTIASERFYKMRRIGGGSWLQKKVHRL